MDEKGDVDYAAGAGCEVFKGFLSFILVTAWLQLCQCGSVSGSTTSVKSDLSYSNNYWMDCYETLYFKSPYLAFMNI